MIAEWQKLTNSKGELFCDRHCQKFINSILMKKKKTYDIVWITFRTTHVLLLWIFILNIYKTTATFNQMFHEEVNLQVMTFYLY